MICVGGGFGALLGLNGNVCLVQNRLQAFGATITYGGGFQAPAAAGVSLEWGVSNAPNICDLGGPFSYGGGTFGPAAVDVQWGKDSTGQKDVVVVSGGPGLGVIPAEAHGGKSNTLQTTFFTL